MTDNGISDSSKLREAIQCIRKTLQCTMCHKLPTDPVAPKCGHPLCQDCVDRILNTKRAICTICKGVIIKSGLQEIESSQKIVADFESLHAAVEEESSVSTQPLRQYRGKRKSLSLRDPSSSRTSTTNTETTEILKARGRPKKIGKKTSLRSDETIKINGERSKIIDTGAAVESPSRNVDNPSPVFTTYGLSTEIGAIRAMDKVKSWLRNASEDKASSDHMDSPEISEPRPNSTSTETFDLDSSPRIDSNSRKGSKSRGESKDERGQRGKKKSMSNDEIFDELQRDVEKKESDKNKSKNSSALAESSWSELKQFKKEARSNIRKRKRLNISIERPSSTKPVVENSDKGNSEEEKEAEEEVDGAMKSEEKRMRPNIISYKTLDKSERFDVEVEKLNKRQVKEIIGVADSDATLDASKNSTASLEKSNRSKTSLIKSLENSRDRNKEEELQSRCEDNSRPQSRLSLHANDPRPESRLSNRSQGKRTSDKFKLSTRITSLTPNASPAKESSDQNAAVQPRDEKVREKIELGSNSPVKTSNDSIRTKLSLRRLPSTGSSRATDRGNRGVVNITKMGRLYKPRNRIKFHYLGSARSEFKSTGPNSAATTSGEFVVTRDAQTQTSPEVQKLLPSVNIASVTSTGLRRIEEIGVASTSKTAEFHNSLLKKLDTENKVNMMAPEDDSQLKYLATESPFVPRISVQKIGETSRAVKKSSFVSSGGDGLVQNTNDYVRNLIVTDSEGQDSANENSSRIERGVSNRAEKIDPEKKSPENNAKIAQNYGVINERKSPSIHNEENLSRKASPKRKKLTRKSSGSLRVENLKLQEDIINKFWKDGSESDNDTETIKISITNNKDGSCQLEDSEPMLSATKHKVVRKLDYSQESGSNRNTEPEKSGSNNKEKKKPSSGKKTYQKARLISSSESDDESLEISLTTKESSSNSQTIMRPTPSHKPESLILSQDISVAFSSNKETVEPKRKRALSPNSLDNDDLKSIASNWCDGLGQSWEEIAADNNAVSGHKENAAANISVPSKKPRIDTPGSPMSSGSDQFPVLSPTAIYGSKEKNKDKEILDTRSLKNTEKSPLSLVGKITPAKNGESLSFNDLTRPGRSRPGSTQKDNFKRISPVKSIERKNKENQLSNPEGRKIEPSMNVAQKTTPRGHSKKTMVPSKTDSGNNTDLFESFNGDCLNITQEQLLMQEVEDNLLGRKTKSTLQENGQNKVPEKLLSDNNGRTLSKKDTTTGSRSKDFQIARIDSNDSMNMSDDDIIERTPTKNSVAKKDLSTYVGNSQRSDASLKSFMSVEMTPIPNRIPKPLQLVSDVSPLVERNSRLSSDQRNLSTRISSHSTPKATTSVAKKLVPNGVQNGEGLCFVCSCLTLPQVQNVKVFARMHNIVYTADYMPEVTHVIVGTNDSDTAGRTLKYLLGVAHKKWIVSYRWIIDCMSEGRLLPEEKYEAVDGDSEEPGPRKSRLSETGLFDNFAFCCMKPFNAITIFQLQDLLTSTGGIFTELLEELAVVTDRHKIILYDGDIQKPDVLETWRTRAMAQPVQVEWALSCISQYHLISFRDYIDFPDSEFVSGMGYPSELFVDEDDSGNDASTM